MSEISQILERIGQRKIYQPGDVDYEIDLFLYFGEPYNTPVPNISVKVDIFLGIECDGHDYHEKTKEQARKDKSKDRQLKMRGLEIIRFTGSEISRHADKCAKEVHKVVIAQRKKINEIIKLGNAEIIKFPEKF